MAKPDAVRITTARSSAADDMRARQRRYAISMTIRIVCFVAAVAVGPGVLRWVLVAAAVFLPLFAVIMANAED
jgi:fatty acid desaturase